MSAVAEMPKTERKKYGPFRVLVGSHVEDHPSGAVMPNGRNREILYDKGSDPFFSNSDLTQQNPPNMPPKFHLVGSASVELHTPLVKAPGESDEGYSARLRKLSEEALKLAGVASPTPSAAVAASFTAAQLDAMKLPDLQKLAEEEEIDLKGAKTVGDVVKIIKAAFGIK